MLKPVDPNWEWHGRIRDSGVHRNTQCPSRIQASCYIIFYLSENSKFLKVGKRNFKLCNKISDTSHDCEGMRSYKTYLESKNFSPVNHWSIPELLKTKENFGITPGLLCDITFTPVAPLLHLCCNKWDNAVTNPLKLKFRGSDMGGFPGPRAEERDCGMANPPPSQFGATTHFWLEQGRFWCQHLRNWDNLHGPLLIFLLLQRQGNRGILKGFIPLSISKKGEM